MDIFGGLIEFNDKKEFVEFMDDIDERNAVKLIETSINYALKSGLFDLDESYAIYKSLLKIKLYENNADSNLLTDDSNGSSNSI